MASRKHWGEFEDEERDESILQNVNFNPIIELGMQNIPEIPISVKSSPIELPKPNLITHTILLHSYSRQLSAILEQTENAVFEGARLDPMSFPTMPPEPPLHIEHAAIPPINFLEKEYCDFSLGKGPVILPFTPESHQRALRHCAAISLGHIGVSTCTNTAVYALADALDFYMTNMCKLMRTVVDREASGIKSGFPDVIQKVFADLNIGHLGEFYENRVIKYHAKVKNRCIELRSQCEALAVGDIAPQLKLEEVPELHFPAALDGAFTPSLEPGFQMLHSLEQEQLQGLDILDTVSTDDIKVEAMEFSQPDAAVKLLSLSPSAKKKRKLVPLSPKSSSDDGIHEELRELLKNSRETYSDFSIFGNKPSICIQKVASGEMELVQKTTDGHPKTGGGEIWQSTELKSVKTLFLK